jgi:hypothetical protein
LQWLAPQAAKPFASASPLVHMPRSRMSSGKVAAERGFDIKVVEFTDYVIPNQALALGISKRIPFSMNLI